MIDLLLWLIVGSAAGWVSSRLMMKTRRRQSSASDVFVGIAGAVLGGGLVPARLGIHRDHAELFSVGALLVALVSALLLLIVVNVVRPGSSR